MTADLAKKDLFGEFGYLNSSFVGKSITVLFLSSSRGNSDGRQHGVFIQISINLVKRLLFSLLNKTNCCDPNLGESLCIVIVFLFSDCELILLILLNGLYFYFGVTSKTTNKLDNCNNELIEHPFSLDLSSQPLTLTSGKRLR